jgi:ribosome-associated protein
VTVGEPKLMVAGDLTIPLSELTLTFTGSSGPGGQHVNKSATRVTVAFDVAASPSLSQEQRARILETLASRLDGRGVLRVSAMDTRSQHRNRELALERLAAMLARAIGQPRPRMRTRPTPASIERRLAAKRRNAERKIARGRRVWPPDDAG